MEGEVCEQCVTFWRKCLEHAASIGSVHHVPRGLVNLNKNDSIFVHFLP